MVLVTAPLVTKLPNAHAGRSPPGALIVIRILDPDRKVKAIGLIGTRTLTAVPGVSECELLTV